ncbi:MAG: glycosyltransferase family 4 protein [Gaiellaceae bacterium]
MRVALIDPAAFTTPYDHHLASALAALELDVELITSRFRFGEGYTPAGYRRTELFYPLSGRLFGRSILRLPVRAAEHVVGMARLRRRSWDVMHVQWAPLPQVDARGLPTGGPSVMTAHDILPRRSAHKVDLWRRLYGCFDRVVTHSEHGRDRLAKEVGLDTTRVRVIPHPVFPGTTAHTGTGRTVLAPGVIRPYKQIDHALAACRACNARLLVVGDPTFPLEHRQDAPNTEWRLGYRTHAELQTALSEATVAIFPYRAELDQSGALLRALGSGVPVVAYDVGGMAEPVRRFGAGTVVAPDDEPGLARALSELLDDPARLEEARQGALRAREELNWAASAREHLAMYRELVES